MLMLFQTQSEILLRKRKAPPSGNSDQIKHNLEFSQAGIAMIRNLIIDRFREISPLNFLLCFVMVFVFPRNKNTCQNKSNTCSTAPDCPRSCKYYAPSELSCLKAFSLNVR